MRISFRLLLLLAAFAASQTLSRAQTPTDDTTPPTLSTLSFSASSVNVSSAPQTLTVNATIADDLSGVSYAYIYFYSPSSTQYESAYLSRISGSNLEGNYTTTVNFPQFLQAGTWTATFLAYDNAGNHISIASATLVGRGLPGTLTVVDTAPDTTPPTLLGASFSPSSVDTSAGPQSFTITLQISDSQTGVTFTNFGYYDIYLSQVGASSEPFQYVVTTGFKLVSGTAQNGTWQGSWTMPQYSGGNWEILYIYLYDAVGNEVTLTSTQLSAMGIKPILTDTSVPADTTPPALTGLSFSPSVFDTSLSSQTVTITESASDDISGLSFGLYDEFQFTSPSGNQTVYAYSNAPKNVAGTPLSGTWQFTAQWPQYSEEGTWNLSYAYLLDKVGNFKSYGPSQLTALGFPSTIVVTKPSLASDGTIGPAGGTVDDSAFGTRASITFPAGLVSSPTTVAISVFPTPLSVPTPRGFTTPGTYFENLSFVPSPPEPLPAPGITVVLPLLTPMTPGAKLSLYHIDPIIGLAPAINASGHPAVGTVDAGGVSATFNNVVTFSTVVAYLSNGSVLGDVNGDGSVTCADVSILKSSFGTHTGQAGFNSAADLNNDGTVNILDLFIVSRQLPAGTVCQ